jgi:DNA-binding PadR family transcriptional regulator
MTRGDLAICDHGGMPQADRHREPLLGEWACLGILYGEAAHGWAIVKQLRPDGEIGRIWHLSTPLTYRAIDQLTVRAWIEPVGEEPGNAGPNRTILAATRIGRAQFRTWVRTPVPHLRDLRSELLLKLVFAARYQIEIGAMLDRQREIIDEHATSLGDTDTDTDTDTDDVVDVVRLWRSEATEAARRFLDRIHPSAEAGRSESAQG